MNVNLHIVPILQAEAFAFIDMHHRHHKAPTGSIFQIACSVVYDACDVKSRKEIEVYHIVGVVIVGRPVSRHLDDGFTLEVIRLCTTGEKNVCSKLYSSAWKTAKSLGWKKLITYILSDEKGTSLYASNWKLIGEAGGGKWSRISRPRIDNHPTQKKLLFQAQ